MLLGDFLNNWEGSENSDFYQFVISDNISPKGVMNPPKINSRKVILKNYENIYKVYSLKADTKGL